MLWAFVNSKDNSSNAGQRDFFWQRADGEASQEAPVQRGLCRVRTGLVDGGSLS